MTARAWRASDSADVLAYVSRLAGLRLPAHAPAAIGRLAARRGARDAASLLARIPAEPELLDQLVAEATVGETYFFRDPAQLEFIRRDVLPGLRAGALRVWSAGCATGEEAYSLAILLREAGLGTGARIVGTDVCRHRLARAVRGRYTDWSMRGVPDPVVRRYFVRAGAELRLADEVRRAVEFRPLNLAVDEYPSTASGIWGMHLVLCRNVLIYLDPPAVARVARRLLASLAPDGWLVLGASDPPLSDLVPCRVVVTDAGIAYRPALPRRTAAPSPRLAGRAEPSPPSWHPDPRRREGVPPGGAGDRVPPAAPSVSATAGPVSVATTEGRAEAKSVRAAVSSVRVGPGGEAGDDAGEAVARVRALADRGALEEAGVACAAALEAHRGSPELLALHALLLSEGGRHREAADAAGRALYLDPGSVAGHLALARALAGAADPRGAARALRGAERLLAALPADDEVPGTGGEPAGRLLRMTRAQLRLLDGGEA
jgi:chemotaxis protein methyltransferase CheR